MRRSLSNPTEIQRGSGDNNNNKPITVKVVDSSISPSSSSIHKLSRVEICKTLNDIRDYLINNPTPNPTPKSTPTKKRVVEIDSASDTDEITATSSGISENIGFLAFENGNTAEEAEERSTVRSIVSPIRGTPYSECGLSVDGLSEVVDNEKQLPWVLESKNKPSAVSKPLKQQNPAISRPRIIVPKAYKNATPAPRPRWTFGSAQRSIYSSDYSSSGKTTPLTIIEEGVHRKQNQGVTKVSAIYRFQKFLERTRKLLPHAGVHVCVQPEIAPEVMASIQVLYDQHYDSSSDFNNYGQWENVDVDYMQGPGGDNQHKPFHRISPEPQPRYYEEEVTYVPLQGQDQRQGQQGPRHNPKPMQDQYGQKYGNYQPEPPTNRQYHQASTNYPPHPELLDFSPEPNFACHKRRTKFTMKPPNSNKVFPYHGSQFRHTHPNEPLHNSYQNILADHCQNHANQFNKPTQPPPPPPPQQINSNSYWGQPPSQEGQGGYYGNQFHQPTPQMEQYYQTYFNQGQGQSQGEGDFGQQQWNNYSDPNQQEYHHTFIGY